ncbi:hypothetical protein [Flavobacterium sp.]|uniref:hypothetical protein n=1 Tax=Flavobacterium sp. TaxID=239 RepID=UPI0040486213
MKNNNYEFIDNKKFSKKTKNIFGRTLDYNSEKLNIILNFSNPCNKNLIFNKNTGDEMIDYTIYISKNDNFISELFSIPEILNYEEIYPEIVDLEKSIPVESNGIKIYKWHTKKDLNKIRQKKLKAILSRNKFLLNDDESNIDWLIENDSDFLKNLVINYGFDRNVKINEFVINELYNKYDGLMPVQTDKIGEIFFKKKCDNSFDIRDGLLKYVENATNEKDNRFVYSLVNYVYVLFDGDLNKVYNNDPSKEFNDVEKATILAIIGNLEIQLTNKFKQLNPRIWDNESSVLYNIGSSKPKFLNIIEKSNYFNIPNLKETIETIKNEIEVVNSN